MSAEEALEYGLIDEIVAADSEKLRALALPPPGQTPNIFDRTDLPTNADEYQFGKIVSTVIFILFYLITQFNLISCYNKFSYAT